MSNQIVVDGRSCSIIALNQNQYHRILASDEFQFVNKQPSLVIAGTYNFDKLRGIAQGYTLILADCWNKNLPSDARYYWESALIERQSRGVVILKSKW